MHKKRIPRDGEGGTSACRTCEWSAWPRATQDRMKSAPVGGAEL